MPEGVLLGFNAGYAVMFFYIISGFLITFTLTENYEKSPRGYARFYRNRFIRIFSLYWPMAAVAFYIFPGSAAAFFSASAINLFAGIFLIFSDWLVTFGKPGGQYFGFFPPALNQAWTLGAELTFYLVAPLMLRYWKLAMTVLVTSLLIRASFVVVLGAGLHEQWTYTFLPSTFVFFLLGHFAMRAGARWPLLENPHFGIGLTVAALATMEFAPGGSFDNPRFWLSVILFVVALPGLFAATKSSRMLNYIGNLSYPVYLVHILVFIVAGDWIAKFIERTIGPIASTLPVLASTLLFMLAVIIAAIATHHLAEKPCAWLMRFIARSVARALLLARSKRPKLSPQ